MNEDISWSENEEEKTSKHFLRHTSEEKNCREKKSEQSYSRGGEILVTSSLCD